MNFTSEVGMVFVLISLLGKSCPLSFMLVVQAGPDENLKDVVLKILQNNVATVPVIHSSSGDALCPQLLHLASLSGILKCKVFN